jgi:hypothetical protein
MAVGCRRRPRVGRIAYDLGNAHLALECIGRADDDQAEVQGRLQSAVLGRRLSRPRSAARQCRNTKKSPPSSYVATSCHRIDRCGFLGVKCGTAKRLGSTMSWQR